MLLLHHAAAHGDYLVLQNEVSCLPEMVEAGAKRGMNVVLNPSPFDDSLRSLDYNQIRWIFINEVEGHQMTGETAPDAILSALRAKYPALCVVLTLGSAGSICCTPEKTVVANVGDSRSYLIRNDRIVFQTVDHSVAQMAVLAGEITADELRQYPKLNLLTRALGRETVKADVTELPADVCDRILLCSDGFWEYVYENELVQPAASPAAWLTALRTLHAQRIPSRNDNHTAVAAMRRREKE